MSNICNYLVVMLMVVAKLVLVTWMVICTCSCDIDGCDVDGGSKTGAGNSDGICTCSCDVMLMVVAKLVAELIQLVKGMAMEVLSDD